MAWGSSFDKIIKPMQEAAGKSIVEAQAADDWRHPVGQLIRETGEKLIEQLSKPNVFSPDGYTWSKPSETADAKLLNDVFAQVEAEANIPVLTGWDLGIGDKTVLARYEDGGMTFKELSKEEVLAKWPAPDDASKMYSHNSRAVVEYLVSERNNKVPTHDPYTNPDAHIYYECNCGQILDPGTKRFAELNNCASKAGWKIRFSDSGYTPYCVECGKGVE